MSTDVPPTETQAPASPPPTTSRRAKLITSSLALTILITAGAIATYWLANRPKAKRRKPPTQAALVEVAMVTSQKYTVIVEAMGDVMGAREVRLASQVAGKIVKVADGFAPGGRFAFGEEILKIEPADYELAVRQRASDLARAESDLRIEMGQQSVAQREYELLGKDVKEEDKELLLRKPQLAKATAAVASARAALDKAKLDLERTTVRAPFNAVIRSRNVEEGAQVQVGAALATLVGTDEYWIRVSAPLDELRWLLIPGRDGSVGSKARVFCEPAWGPGAFRKGVVERLMVDVEPQGRMARILITVPDPLGLTRDLGKRRRLVLGAYTRVEIEGRQLAGVVRVPRSALREGNRVWVLTPQQTLDIREVSLARAANEYVYVSEGLANGELLITSDLGAPVAGMALRAAGAAAATAPAGESGGLVPTPAGARQ